MSGCTPVIHIHCYLLCVCAAYIRSNQIMGWGEKAIEIRSVETGHLDGVFMHKRAQRLKFLCERNDKVRLRFFSFSFLCFVFLSVFLGMYTNATIQFIYYFLGFLSVRSSLHLCALEVPARCTSWPWGAPLLWAGSRGPTVPSRPQRPYLSSDQHVTIVTMTNNND